MIYPIEYRCLQNSRLDINTISDEILVNTNLLTTDSRELDGKQYFICFKGENFDAHDYAQDLCSNPAIKYVFVEKELDFESEKLVKVDSTLAFYHELANKYRKLVNPKVIAVTGSAGKTTTKNLFHLVFQHRFKTHATQKNFNNEYGVPKTILSMSRDTQVLILEMGMRGLGQIDLLTKTAEPDYACITNIGTAHIELLGSRENIRKAKLEIINGLKPGGRIFVDAKLKEFLESSDEYQAIISENDLGLNSFTYLKYAFTPLYLVTEGLLLDMGLVRQVALDFGLGDEFISSLFEVYQPDDGRGNFLLFEDLNGIKNVIFIDETYNSNIEAVRNSISGMKDMFPGNKKIAVLGDIKESDPMQVEVLFKQMNDDPDLDFVDARFLDKLEAKFMLDQMLADECIVFFKASRSEKLEELIELYR